MVPLAQPFSAGPAPSGLFPRIASLWWGEFTLVNNQAMAGKIQLYLAPSFLPGDAAAVRSANPGALILNSINAEETLNGVPVVPDSYFLKDIHGNKIQNWPGNPGNFLLNLTNPAVVTMLAQFALQQLNQTGFVYDGIFFDNVVSQISTTTSDCFGNPVQIDANGDGNPDDPATVDAAWSAGVYSLINQFRQLAPNAYVSGHINQLPPDPRSLAAFNGDSIGFAAVQVREGTAAFGTLYDTYQQWFSQGQSPAIPVIQSSPPTQISYGYGYSPLQVIPPSTLLFGQTFYPNLRFGLGVALMNDGFFDFDFGDSTSPVAWWYDEYGFNLGSAAAPALQIGAGQSSNQVVNGGFESGQAPWFLSVTDGAATLSLDASTPADGARSARVNVTAAASLNWHISIEQDGLAVLSGAEYQVSFWARADTPRSIQIAAQQPGPGYAYYGLNTPVGIDSTWRLYSVSFVSAVTASDARLEFWFGANAGSVWLDDVQMTQAPTRVYRRDFSGGVALVNGTSTQQTIALESGLRRFAGAQAPKYQYIVDDSTASFSASGSWAVKTFDTGFRTASGPYYHAWQATLHELDSGPGSALWNLSIPEDGQYTIQAWLPAAPGSSGWTQSAIYEIVSGSTVLASSTLDQSVAATGDQWFTVANLSLTAASAPFLRVHNGGSSPLIADAAYVFSTSALYNDGAPVTQVVLAPMDGILLQRSSPNQTIGFSAPANQPLGGNPQALNASASSGLPISYIANTPSVCPVSGSMVTPAAVGTCSITATQAGNASYTAAVPVTSIFTIGAGQVISFAAPGAGIAGTPPFVLPATASSGLTVILTSSSPSVCTIAGNAVTLAAIGTCSIMASQAGNTVWAPAPPVTHIFLVQTAQTISFLLPATQVSGSAPLTLNGSATSGLPVAFASVSPTTCAVTGASAAFVAAGTCSIRATQSGSVTFAPAPPVVFSFPVLANSLADNGFESATLSPWQILIAADGFAAGTAMLDFSTAVEGKASARVSVTSAGKSAASTDFEQPSLTFTGGTTYTVQFWAKADSPRVIGVATQGGAPLFASYGLSVQVNIGTAWAPYAVSFAAPLSAADGRLQFLLGAVTGNVWIDAVTLASAGGVAQTLSFAAPATQPWGSGPLPLGVTVSSGLAITLISNTPAICAVSSGSAVFLALGNCSITASQPGDSNFQPAVSVTQNFAIRASQTITFPAIGNQTDKSAPLSLSATSTSSLPVSFSSGSPAICTSAGTTLTSVSMGTCSVTALQAGDSTYAPAVAVSHSFTVLGSQTISFTDPGTKAFGTPPFVAPVSSTSNLAPTLTAGTPGVCTVSGWTVTLLAPGNCSLTATQAGDPSWAPAPPATQQFSVVTGGSTINFPAIGSAVYGSAPFGLSATASSGLPVSFSSESPGVCAVTGSIATLVAAGSCSLTATQSGNANWAAAVAVTQIFSVTPAAQAIAFPAIATQALGGVAFSISATATSGLPVGFLSNTPAFCAVTGIAVTPVAVGICSLSAVQPGNSNWSAAVPVSQFFMIAVNLPGNAGFDSSSLAPWQFFVSDPNARATAMPDTTTFLSGPSSAHISIGSAASAMWQVDLEQPALPLSAGTSYKIQLWAKADTGRSIQVAVQGGAPSFAAYAPTVTIGLTSAWQLYTLSFSSSSTAADARIEFWLGTTAGDVWIDQVQLFGTTAITQTLTFSSLPNITLGAAPFAIAASASSGLLVNLTANTPAICSLTGQTLSVNSGGTCSLTATQAGNGTYLAAPPVTRTFVVLVPQTINFAGISNQAVGAPPLTLAATAVSGLPVSFTSLTPVNCTVSGTTATLLTAGTCSVTALQPGNATYAAALSVTQSFQIGAGFQTISFPAVANQVYGTLPFPVPASATSGLPVSFVSGTPATCTVSGATLAFVGTGTCTLSAAQSGNANWSAASPVVHNFSVSPAGQSINFPTVATQAPGGMPFAVPATATSGLPVTLASTTPLTCMVAGASVTPQGVGICSVVAAQAGNLNWSVAASVSQSFMVANNLLRNGGFDMSSMVPWQLFVTDANARAAVTLDPSTQVSGPSSTRITVATVASGIWQVDLEQPTLPLSAGTGYRIQFWAKADSNRTIQVAVQGGAPTYSNYAPATSVPITTVWQVYSIGFASSTTAIDARLEFWFGTTSGNVWLDQVQLFGSTSISQTLAFSALPNITFGAAPFAIGASASSGLPVSLVSATPGICALAGQTLSVNAGGTCSLTATQAGNSTYLSAPPVTRSFVVLLPQTLNFGGLANQMVGAPLVTLGATATSGLPVTFSTNTSTCSIAVNVLTLLTAGACSVTAAQTGNSSYAAAPPVTQSFVIGAGFQTINFAGVSNQIYGTAPFAIPVNATSGLPVNFTVTTPAVCTVSGVTLTVIGPGTCTLTANQPGNANWSAAAPVLHNFSVAPAAQSLVFPVPATQSLGGVPVAIGATASSGLPVTFTTTTPSVCSVTGSLVTPLAIGTCSIMAAQSGNANWSAAVPVAQSFAIASNLLANAGFDVASLAPWQFFVTDPNARATGTPDTAVSIAGPSSAHIAVTTAATGSWQVDLEQSGLSVSTGTSYKIRFWAKADANRTIQVAVQGGAPSYAAYGPTSTVAITGSWQLYTLTFTSTATAADARLEFWFGATAGNIWLDQVQLFH